MLDFIELGLNIKHKIKIYTSSTDKKQTTMHSRRQAKPLMLFNELYDKDTYTRYIPRRLYTHIPRIYKDNNTK